MSKSQYWKLRVEDILVCIQRIQEYLANLNYEDFSNDQKTIDAVIGNLEIIGEAANRIPKEITEKFNNINWEGMIGLRNIIAHQYFDIDLRIIWRIANEQIPKLKKQLLEILSSKNYE